MDPGRRRGGMTMGEAAMTGASGADGRPAGRWNDLGRREKRCRGRDLPDAGQAGHQGRAVQGAEHVEQLRGRARRRGDRAGAGAAGAGVRARTERAIQSGAAQARQRPALAAGGARQGDLPVLLVGDIDRGGVLAHLFGTVAILEPEDQRLISGFIVNKLRGDVDLLRPGLDELTALTGRPTLGVLPYAHDLWIDAEDSLGTLADAPVGRSRPPRGSQWLTVAAIRLPRISN